MATTCSTYAYDVKHFIDNQYIGLCDGLTLAKSKYQFADGRTAFKWFTITEDQNGSNPTDPITKWNHSKIANT